MRPAHFACVRLIVASTLMLAQSNPVSLNPNRPANISRSGRGLPFQQRASRKVVAPQNNNSQAQGLSFAPPVEYTFGFYPSFITIGDLRGNGKRDLVVSACPTKTCPTPGTVGVLLGNGDGTFKPGEFFSSGGLEPVSVAIADVNGDGKPDLVVANNCADPCSGQADGSVAVLLGNGDGTFQAPVTYDSGGGSTVSVAVADMNGDGKPDIVVANLCSDPANCSYSGPGGSVSVLLNNGNGTLKPVVSYDINGSVGGIYSVALGDLTGSGKPDVVVTSDPCPVFGCEQGSIGVLLNNGDGTLQTAVDYPSGGDDPVSLSLADVNGDGKLDVVAANERGLSNPGTSAVGVLLGNGDGTFRPAVAYVLNTMGVGVLNRLAVADVNGDGKPDVVADLGVGCGGESVAVFLGNGDGTFQPELDFCSAGFATSIALADLNGDGLPDVAITTSTLSQNPAPTNVLINTTSGAAQDFFLAASPPSVTVTPGQTGNYTLTVSPVNGFSHKVGFTCSGAPPQSTCTVTPISVTLNGTANATADVAVVTTGASASLVHPYGFPSAGDRLALWLALPGLSGLVFFASSAGRTRKRHRRLFYGLVFLCLLSVAVTWPACGGGSSSGATPRGTYSITVTGTYTSGSATLTHATKLTLVVQ
jgi:hypothetical protein